MGIPSINVMVNHHVAVAPSSPLKQMDAMTTPVAGSRPDPRSVLTMGRWLYTLGTLSIVSMGVLLVCLRFGAEDISLDQAVRIFGRMMFQGEEGLESSGTAGVILVHLRVPRIILSLLVGSSLATVGVVLQALLRNPLADPYVLGISSGAALGAAVAILMGVGTTVLALSSLPLFAFVGGLISIVLVYRIASTYGTLPIHTLLLAGIILNAVLSALIMFVTSIMDPNRSFGMMSWLMGTMTSPSYSALVVLGLYLLTGGVILFRQAQALNLMTLGEEQARSLGVEVEIVKKTVFLTSALLTGAVVSVSGLIGFVGMVIPHAVRLTLGADHRLLLPAAALVGGTFLTVADTIARTMLAPAEIPVGIVTALVGGPIFLYLLMSRRRSLV